MPKRPFSPASRDWSDAAPPTRPQGAWAGPAAQTRRSADAPPAAGEPNAGWVGLDSDFEAGSIDSRGQGPIPVAGTSQRQRRALIAFFLAGLAGLALLVWTLASAPHLNASWRPTPQGQVQLVGSDDPLLATHRQQVLLGVAVDGLPLVPLDSRLLHQSARWLVDDADRADQHGQSARLWHALGHQSVALYFADGSVVRTRPEARGVTGLPAMFWLLCAFGFALYLVAATALLPNPDARNRAYAVMAWCQALNIVMIAVEATLELGLPEPFARADMPVRMALDLATVAAMVTSVCLYPRRLPGARAIAAAVWTGTIVLVGLFGAGSLPHAWWWIQCSVAACGLVAIGLLSWSYQIEMNPFALVLRRFGVLVVSTWALLTAGLASAQTMPDLPHNVADLGSMVWYVFLGSLLMLAPFLARTHSAMREFALLAAISSVATSLDLLFVSLCAFTPFASLTLALFLSMAAYAGARQWLMNQLLGSSRLTTEHLFEHLYRIAREVEARPERTPLLLARLLGDLFEPLEIRLVDRRPVRTRVASDGSTLLVPSPLLGGDTAVASAVLMRFARRGRRLFSAGDARLTDRLAEQLRRAVHFDQAVEQGRHEERLRLAQDLHDDIGARLLTLIYQAPTQEMGDYVRHTLQDLKTLTRGLAASDHRLSHAAGEWKADLTHRLTAAHIDVHWSFVFDEDVLLNVVQWSGLTRVLRELVSNTIAHARATSLEIDFRLQDDRVELSVADDGQGADPATWAHGLGLGGIRKRVRQLGGSVEWRRAEPHGIGCRVVIGQFSAQR